MRSIEIGQFALNEGRPPFIIAELSANHNGSLDHALAIVEASARAGAHAIKLQTYTADTMTIDVAHGEFLISDPGSLWQGRSLYDLYQEASTPWDWHEPIFRRCRELGMVGFSTPFDATAVDFLESLDVPCHKIASFENTDVELITRVARTGKPVIMSTGMATVAEIAESVAVARDNGCRDLVLLKCTSAYPADPASSNLATIPHMRALFDCHVGLSDHTMGIGAAVAATAFGAVAIEKHVTLRRDDGGVDSTFSMEPEELAGLVCETATAAAAVGGISYGATESEIASRIFRRSLYIVKPMKAGDVLDHENLLAIRPGMGLPVKFLKDLLGKRINCDVERGTAMRWDLIA